MSPTLNKNSLNKSNLSKKSLYLTKLSLNSFVERFTLQIKKNNNEKKSGIDRFLKLNFRFFIFSKLKIKLLTIKEDILINTSISPTFFMFTINTEIKLIVIIELNLYLKCISSLIKTSNATPNEKSAYELKVNLFNIPGL